MRQWVAMAARVCITPTTEARRSEAQPDADGRRYSGTSTRYRFPTDLQRRGAVRRKTKTVLHADDTVAYGAPWTENYFFQNTDVHGNTKLRRFIPHELIDTMVKRRGQWFMPEEYGHVGIAKAQPMLFGRVAALGLAVTASYRV